MIARWQTRLRAWLIDLVREAVRLETGKFSYMMPSDFADAMIRKSASKPLTKPVTVSEPSFDQMQTEAIAKQEKYYEPQSQ